MSELKYCSAPVITFNVFTTFNFHSNSGSQDHSKMIGSDVFVAYYDDAK